MIGYKSIVMFWLFRLELKKWCILFSGFFNFNIIFLFKLIVLRVFLVKNFGFGNGKLVKV